MLTEYKIEVITQKENTIQFRLKRGENYLQFDEVFKLWKDDLTFIRFYKNELIKLNYQAFYWEHPALKKEFLNKKYECILQRSKPLERLQVNESAFKKYIFLEEGAVDFRNLGKDARLVIPTKKSEQDIYNHLGRFIRLAEEKQLIELFQLVGKTILEELDRQEIVWLNTAGLGVIWLHIRMDKRPKYYKTEAYRDAAFLENQQ